MASASVIIVGAGAAGLSAAQELSENGVAVLILEARERLGGRICTMRDSTGEPVELGAEFIHGKDPGLWKLLEQAGVASHPVSDRHWIWRDGKLRELKNFWQGLEKVIGKIEQRGRDRTFAEFLTGMKDVTCEWKELAQDFIEGFDAARIDRIGTHALARDSEQSEKIQGDQSFRPSNGYGQFIEWLSQQVQKHKVPIHCRSKVEIVRWKKGSVIIESTGPAGRQTFEAPHAIITLPLGVLKSGSVRFEPTVRARREAIAGLEMGKVVKVNLQFRDEVWPKKTVGFIHATRERFPTWWKRPGRNLLTAWVGGPNAEEMAGKGEDFAVEEALRLLSRILRLEQSALKQKLETVYFHDWSSDPFACGACSYIPVGLLKAQQKLAEPVQNTLFFAGEAGAVGAQLGTVYGAIASGRKAAQQVYSYLKA